MLSHLQAGFGSDMAAQMAVWEAASTSRVERGETVAVTRRGKPVAHLVAVSDSEAPSTQREQVGQIFERLRQLRSGLSLEGTAQ